MIEERRQSERVLGVCLAMVGALLAAEAGASEPGLVRLRGLEGQVLRVQLEPGTSRLDYTLHLDETANGRVEGARLRVTGLRDESGAQVAPLRVVGADGPVREAYLVEPAGSISLTLEADLPAPGTYEATLTLLQQGAVATVARLVVSRPRPALNVDVDVAPVRGQLPILASQGEATLQFTLHEKEGSPVLLAPPVLARLVRKEGAGNDTGQQALADARVVDAQGAPLEAPFLLDRRMTLPLRLQLSGLPGPGRYEGTLRVGTANAPAVDMPFVLDLREGAPIAFLLIALGVGLSFLMRQYVAHERPRMVLQQRTLAMAQALEELKATPELPSRDQELLACVAREVDGVLADVSGRAGLGGMGSRLELLTRKVACTRDWLRLRRAVDALLPADLRAEPQMKLDSVERPLRAPRVTEEALSTAEATLAGLPAELEERMRRLPAGPVSFSSPEEQGPGPVPFEEMRLFVPRLEGRPPAEGLARLEKQLASLDLLVLGLVLGGAVLTGMKLLWMESPAWGSLNDRLLAFLWGFGLHQASSSGLTSLLGRGMNPEPRESPPR